jgi:hypothetical protein
MHNMWRISHKSASKLIYLHHIGGGSHQSYRGIMRSVVQANFARVSLRGTIMDRNGSDEYVDSVLPPMSAFASQQVSSKPGTGYTQYDKANKHKQPLVSQSLLGWDSHSNISDSGGSELMSNAALESNKTASSPSSSTTTNSNENLKWGTLAAEAAAADSAARQHFYRNRVLERYADQPVHPVTIRQLVFFGRTLDEDKLIRSANYVRTEIPVRLAHRIRDFQRLPYIIGVNRHIATVYGLYWKAFDAFRRMPPIRTIADNENFCQQVEEMIQEHLIVIPQLAMGVRESRSYFQSGDADRFMNASLRSRISRRVLAEQHLALTRQFNEEGRPAPGGRYIGLVDTRCRAGQLVVHCVRTAGKLTRQEFGLPAAPSSSTATNTTSTTFHNTYDEVDDFVYERNSPFIHTIRYRNSLGGLVGVTAADMAAADADAEAEEATRFTCRDSLLLADGHGNTSDGQIPQIIADGHLATVFACIPDHVEYALHELLRNSMRATLQKRQAAVEADPSLARTPLPPIRVTVAEGPADLIFRVSDQGGGINSNDCARLWHFGSDGFRAFETVPELAGKVGEEATRPKVRLGIGLLMARVYAEYWGGGLDLQSMPGWGVDAHLRVSKLGNRLENLGELPRSLR